MRPEWFGQTSADGTRPGTMGGAAPLGDILCACFRVPFQFQEQEAVIVRGKAGKWAIGGVFGRALLPFTRCKVVDDSKSS